MSFKNILFVFLIIVVSYVNLEKLVESDFWWQQLGSKITQNTRRLEKLEQQLQEVLNNRKSLSTPSVLQKQTTSSEKNLPTDCLDVKNRGYNKTDIYLIQPSLSPRPFLVQCEMNSRGGGWTVFLRRIDGVVDFNLNWSSYKTGFGNIGGELWLGLDYLYYLTGEQVNELLIELAEADMKEKHVYYESFSIGSESEGFNLKLLSGFSGNVEDSLTYHAAQKFTTVDKDQDPHTSNCANVYSGGWWYNKCHTVHPTGTYGIKDNSGVNWANHRVLKNVKMMIRPRHY